MKLKRLAINRLPGISQPFEIEAAGAGFQVVFGPNAIGKSSLCRAVEGLYWEDRGSSQRTLVNGEFELDGESWWAERDGSQVRWQRGGEDSVPPNLPASHNYPYFFLRLRDLIDPSLDGTKDIASEIHRQMSGGFDLDRVAVDLFSGVSTRHGRRERNDFNKASQEVQEAEGQQVALQRRADQLDALREQLDSAEASARRLVAVERALGLAGRFADYARVTGEMAALPEALALLTGKETEQVDELQGRLDDLTERTRKLERERNAALEEKRDVRLDAPLDEAALSVWRENAGALGRVELSLEAARNDGSACRNALATALVALGGGDVDEVSLDTTEHGQLFEFLRVVETHRARANAINEQLRLLEHVDRHDDSERDQEKSRNGVDALRSWLRAREPETFLGRIRARLFLVLFALAAAIAGTGLAVFFDPIFALLAAAGLGIAVPILTSRNPAASTGARKSARDAFARLGIEEPDAWDMPMVEMRLRELEGKIATVDARMHRARDRDVERQKLESELEGLAEAQVALDARRQKLADRLNLDAIPPDAELVDFARALDQFRAARIQNEKAAGNIDELEARRTELLSNLVGVIEQHGEPKPEDANTAMAYLNRLSARNTRLVNATSAEKGAADQLEQVATDHEAALNALERIYWEVGLGNGDLPGLAALLQSLPHYLVLKSDATRLEAQIELDREALATAGEATLAERDGPTLETLQRKLSLEAEEAADLRDEIAAINAQIAAAKRGSDMQDLIAAREETRTKLLDRREEAMFAQAGKFMVDAVEAEYEQTQLPRVFERARDHFSVFTHHKYELRLSREADAPRLIAIDLGSGEGRRLDELSDGTRAQLLLSARIAFAEEVEQGRTLPLFLDEALDQSDPARFEAIVCSLGQIANDQDRQIFYLTSDPSDVERIRYALTKENYEIAAEIDLGLIRTNAASVIDPASLHVAPRPAVPKPDGSSAEKYGATLGVPVFQPALGHMGQHFFHVLPDDLDQLHGFLVNGIERVGQWKNVADTPFADRLCSGSVSAQQITNRTDFLEVFCEFWKQGRGRPVDREALEESAALSERYLDSVVMIAEEQGQDPERLLDFLRTSKDPRLKGFRKTSFESLERYLRDNAYLDDHLVLNEEELRLRALASPAANNLPDGIANDLLNRWWTLAKRGNKPISQ